VVRQKVEHACVGGVRISRLYREKLLGTAEVMAGEPFVTQWVSLVRSDCVHTVVLPINLYRSLPRIL
jgi:hypothetical protein